MNNTITAHIEFDFKGEHFSLETELDLDQLMATYGKIPDLYPLIAKHHHIDPYSYEYEVMLTQSLTFSHPQGRACSFLKQGQFDQKDFEQDWHEQRLYRQLLPLLKQHLDIDDIEQVPELKPIILAAYHMGQTQEYA